MLITSPYCPETVLIVSATPLVGEIVTLFVRTIAPLPPTVIVAYGLAMVPLTVHPTPTALRTSPPWSRLEMMLRNQLADQSVGIASTLALVRPGLEISAVTTTYQLRCRPPARPRTSWTRP